MWIQWGCRIEGNGRLRYFNMIKGVHGWSGPAAWWLQSVLRRPWPGAVRLAALLDFDSIIRVSSGRRFRGERLSVSVPALVSVFSLPGIPCGLTQDLVRPGYYVAVDLEGRPLLSRLRVVLRAAIESTCEGLCQPDYRLWLWRGLDPLSLVGTRIPLPVLAIEACCYMTFPSTSGMRFGTTTKVLGTAQSPV
ncbi:hypothetical protein BGX38DRAFT_777124 [Terfezia claveryi]|nr:hypothetical protein BGX38DRAFT_777124 [Terfezia claveryi]